MGNFFKGNIWIKWLDRQVEAFEMASLLFSPADFGMDIAVYKNTGRLSNACAIFERRY